MPKHFLESEEKAEQIWNMFLCGEEEKKTLKLLKELEATAERRQKAKENSYSSHQLAVARSCQINMLSLPGILRFG